jgi:hypothetical protein
VGGRLNDAVGNEDLAAFLEEKHRPIIQIPENDCVSFFSASINPLNN